jgi:TolB-like protein/DNA-binding winged helix-turn-helix (wHTH) protein/Tfp pilus assembly protein PilF
MVVGNPRDNSVCFGDFRVDFNARQIERNGSRVPLQGQPFHILEILLRKPGAVVSRQALAEEIWPSGTFVDFEHSLNTAVKKLRKALEDNPDDPTYIETVPRYGYRFIGTILQSEQPAAPLVEPAPEAVPVWHQRRVVLPAYLRQFTKLDIATLSAALIVLVVAAAWRQPEGFRTRASGKPIASVAILPLENSTGDPGKEYLADGMTDALIASVAQFQGLSVTSRGAATAYRGSSKPLAQIMRELHVDAVITGDVTESNGVVALSAQMLRSDAEAPVWAGKYQGKLGNLLRLQDDVAAAIGHQVHATLPAIASARIAKNAAGDSPGYEDYLRGRYFLGKRGDQDLARAETYFDQSIGADSSFAPAYAGLADTYTLEVMYGEISRTEGSEKAQATARKALQLDDSLAEAHNALGGVEASYLWDWVGSEREFQRAIQLNPSYAPAHHWYAVFCLAPQGRLDEALVEIQRAHELEPLSPIVDTDLGFVYYLRGQFPEAKDALSRALEIDPNFIPAHFRLSQLYLQIGKLDDSIHEMITDTWLARKDGSKAEQELHREEAAYRAEGYRGYVRRSLARGNGNPNLGAHDYYEALKRLALGEKDLAIADLAAAADAKDPGMLYAAVDPALKSIRSDPRFQGVLKRMGLLTN